MTGKTATRVAHFLDAYAAGPGRTTAEQTADLVDLTPTIERMDVHEAPFVFGVIDNFLPKDLYDAVLQDWPSESALATPELPGSGAAEPYLGSRKTKLLENWETGDQPQAATWNQVRLALRVPTFVNGLFRRFASTVEANLDALDPAPESGASFRLYANFDQGAKEALGAHIDALRKLLTIVVYLDLTGDVDVDSPSRWGTALYGTGPGEIKPLTFSTNAQHTVAYQIEFQPNRAFVMPNASNALHGVAGGQEGVARRTLMCGYWLASQR